MNEKEQILKEMKAGNERVKVNLKSEKFLDGLIILQDRVKSKKYVKEALENKELSLGDMRQVVYAVLEVMRESRILSKVLLKK